ncbi:MAG: hypothetical protein BRC46_16860 [Cyanobacteria bacterium QS_6_48_18]|nr:MAG: hypothetical protein BRC46_16860 [Cyanobacteria bacterium QS_6_48_18]
MLQLNSQNIEMFENAPKKTAVPVVSQLTFLKMEVHIIKSLNFYVKPAVASLSKPLQRGRSLLGLKK